MGSRQELKAAASVDALAQLQVPHARVRRAGRVEAIESVNLVPGDVVLLEAGDVVPADGRIVTSATLEVQEAALTGESARVRRARPRFPRRRRARRPHQHGLPEHAGPRAGRPRRSLTATGQTTEMGRIADMVTATQRVKSPLQR